MRLVPLCPPPCPANLLARAGVKESDTGLAPPNLWDLPADKQRMGEEHPLQVARCTKIIRLAPNADGTPATPNLDRKSVV